MNILTWTLVEHFGLRHIPPGESHPLSNLDEVSSHGQDGVEGGAAREGVSGVVHDALVVVVQTQGVYFLLGKFVEVVLLT